ncbi:hypothetical protein EVAR_37338_1 [Eumeta japonica]|uniref:Uncharacterized protein n=1 Tax=Eumeta variegata TaxID=151549 RepID=A0A4C1WZB0_EUMVA|nr:hypothetical protein EVAR_37338_1 [Eumeta japonica]
MPRGTRRRPDGDAKPSGPLNAGRRMICVRAEAAKSQSAPRPTRSYLGTRNAIMIVRPRIGSDPDGGAHYRSRAGAGALSLLD